MYLKTQGLVLRITDYNDTDAFLTILTRDYGKLTVKARGLRRKRSPLIAACQLLSYGEFTLFEYRGAYVINEASVVEAFRNLRADLEKLSMGSYFAQAAELISQEDCPSPELLSLVLNSLYALDKLKLSEVLVKFVFELRAACIAGYTPDLSGCYICGNPEPDLFDVFTGRLKCSGCAGVDASGLMLPITPGMLAAMRYVIHCDEKKLYQFEISQESAVRLACLTESFFTAQLEHSFSALDFYKSLLI